MAFANDESSLLLTSPLQVTGAFEALKQAPVLHKNAVSPSALPFDGTWEKGHIQGVTTSDHRIAFATSADLGHIMLGETFSTGYGIHGEKTISALDHPGGVQAVGRFLATPVYDSDQTREVQIRDMDGDLNLVNTLQLSSRGFCVGIADTYNGGTPDDCFYVVAVVVDKDGDRIEFYTSQPRMPLDDARAFQSTHSQPAAIWNVADADKSGWIDGNWGGYANNISLLADKTGKVYFVGFHNTSPTGIGGKDWADLYEVELDPQRTPGTILKKIAKWEVNTSPKISFRWGASVAPTSATSMQLIACEKRVGGDNNTIELNVIR